jgi:hypothetical protein
MQVEPPPHVVQLVPQWAESVSELHALSEHFVLPAGHIERQEPPLQTWPDAQAVQEAPQCVTSEATQLPPQDTYPLAHWQEPLVQVWLELQTVLQLPQAWGSVMTFLQF